MLILIGIFNFPIGLLSLLSAYLMRSWFRKSNSMSTYNQWIGKIPPGKPKVKQHFVFPLIYMAILAFFAFLLYPVNSSLILFISIMFFLTLLALLLLYFKVYLVSSILFIIVGIISVPLGLLLIYQGAKIYYQQK